MKKVIFTKTENYLRQMTLMMKKIFTSKNNHMDQISHLNILLDKMIMMMMMIVLLDHYV